MYFPSKIAYPIKEHAWNAKGYYVKLSSSETA